MADTKLNQLLHEVEIYIESGFGQKLNINPNSIVNLKIHDTLAQWPTDGTLTFFYNPDIDSSIYNSKTGAPETPNVTTGLKDNTSSSFTFSNDGNDRLFIHIVPLPENSNESLVGAEKIPGFTITDRLFWSLTYEFAIYNMEDIDMPPGAQNAASSMIKALKLYFWDSWYQKLTTNIIEYSTGESTLANPQDDINNGFEHPGTIPTGLAMKEILEKSLQNKLKIGEGEDWEEGATNIFFTAPAQTTAYESLMYVHEYHISNKSENDAHDVSILVKEKGPNYRDTGFLTLRPLSYYFNKAGNTRTGPGEYQIEHYFLQSYSDAETENRALPYKEFKAPLSTANNETVDIKTSKYHTITNYRFVDIASVTNSNYILNMPVYSVNLKDREFNVEFQTNKASTAKDFISNNYINRLYKNGSPQDLFLINLDEDKKNKNIKPVFSLTRDDSVGRQAEGLQKIIYNGLFQNTCINFRVLGLTCREPGRFIGIDKPEGADKGEFDNRFFGQWFIIDIKHVIESEIYYNDITAVKIHRFESL
jgi:hypothetical protein